MKISLQIRERRIFLILLDLIALYSALFIYISIRPEYKAEPNLLPKYLLWLISLVLIWSLVGSAFDVYEFSVTNKISKMVTATLRAALLTDGIFILIPFVSPPLAKRRLFIFSFIFLSLLFLLAGRFIYFLIFSHGLFRRRVLIIGSGAKVKSLIKAMAEQGAGMYELLGIVKEVNNLGNEGREINWGGGNIAVSFLSADGREEVQNRKREVEEVERVLKGLDKQDLAPSPWPILGSLDSLKGIIKKHKVDILILALEKNISGQALQLLMDSLEEGIEIVPMPVFYEELTGRVPVEHVGESWQVAMPLDHPLTKAFNRLLKRIMDIVLATTGLLFLVFFFPLIALAIYLDSPGPIFYAQERVGKGGKIFKAYKFRSMIPEAEKGRPIWAKNNDERVTRVGRILRKTHLDEFPQLLNILKGEMSTVGPRPERPEFVEELAKEIPFYRVRHAVKPGMAGWGLVKQGYSASKVDALVKLQYDLYYIKHQSLWFDLVILLKTVFDTLTFRGRA